jgi:hypothetical protein
MVIQNNDLFKGKSRFPLLPALKFLSSWLFYCENFLAARAITDKLTRWQRRKNFSIHTVQLSLKLQPARKKDTPCIYAYL